MCDLRWGNPCLLDNPCLWDRVLESVRGGGQEGSKPRGRAKQGVGCTAGTHRGPLHRGAFASGGGREHRVCAGGDVGGRRTRAYEGRERRARGGRVREGGSGGQGKAARVHAGTPGARGRRASTAGYRGQVRSREGREAVGRDGGAGRAPRESSGEGLEGQPRAQGEGEVATHGGLPPRATGPRGAPLPRRPRAGGGPAELPRPRARRAGGQRYLTAPGATPLPRRLPPHRRAAAGPAPRPCPRGGRRGVPRPPTSPFVSGCSSSVRLGLATRVSLAGREAEVLQQQLLNRQWLPWLPPPPPSGAGGRRGRGAPGAERGAAGAGGGAPAPGMEGDPGRHGPLPFPSPRGGKKGAHGGGREFLMETL